MSEEKHPYNNSSLNISNLRARTIIGWEHPENYDKLTSEQKVYVLEGRLALKEQVPTCATTTAS